MIYEKLSKGASITNVLKIAFIVFLFALASYYLYFYTSNQFSKRHVADIKKLEELDISKWRPLIDKISAILILIVGVLFMILILLS